MDTRSAGVVVLLLVCSLYAYYTAWLLITPFVEEGQPILRLFPSSYWAVAVPVLAGVVLFGVTLLTLGAFLVVGELAKLRPSQRAQPKPKEA